MNVDIDEQPHHMPKVMNLETKSKPKQVLGINKKVNRSNHNRQRAIVNFTLDDMPPSHLSMSAVATTQPRPISPIISDRFDEDD